MKDYSQLANAHPEYIESLYQQYSHDPTSLDPSWARFFEGFDYGHSNDSANGQASTVESIDTDHFSKELKVMALIRAYRIRGHMDANIDPIGQFEDPDGKLDLASYGLSENDYDTVFQCAKELFIPPSRLEDIIKHLQRIYCSNIGFEYHHISDREKRRWLRTRIEQSKPENYYDIAIEEKKHILNTLVKAVGFEEFLKKKYPGQKRFGLEGGESTIVCLDTIIQQAAAADAEEIVIGMAHRGRLNVLTNIMGKDQKELFFEFDGGMPEEVQGDGDVKYHLGYSSLVAPSIGGSAIAASANGKQLHLKLVPNPSHLETVNPIVEGFARAKADMLYGNDYDKILPILIHGDAAVAGQGVVFETIQMEGLEAYTTGGTIHVVINNQIGFTTDYNDARTSLYATGVAGVVEAPVFHVNGDDPEAVFFASKLAFEFRQAFNCDVFLDILCYRRNGHNEGDDPYPTQPLLYNRVKNHPNPLEVYREALASRGVLEKQLADKMADEFNDHLQRLFDGVRNEGIKYRYQEPEEAWRKLNRNVRTNKDFEESPITGVPKERLTHILHHLNKLPDGFEPVSKMGRIFKGLEKSITDNKLDWGACEMAAFGSILLDGADIRFSGQDVERGTFSHRHSIIHEQSGLREHNRLDGLAEKQGKFRIFNSHLSEYAVLGFEYGYAMSSPSNLVLWEAQFGDFANGASIIFDQFISAGESKWGRMNGLVTLLPHGQEGQGPEHSSARPERFLQLCAEYNMVIANTTQPANFFHLLRRQLAWNFRVPLIHMAPKSLLRHPMAVSSLEEMADGKRFQEILDDPSVGARGNKKVKRLLLCTGKVYYDLAQYKADNKREDVAIIRFEQLYPLPYQQVQKLLRRYEGAELVWVQEEGRNAGYWHYISEQFLYNEEMGVNKALRYVGRKATASPATGYKIRFDEEQQALVARAFAN